MASKVVPSSAQQTVKRELTVLTMSDHDIMNQIYATHVHGDEKFDVDSLFILVENILKRSTLIVDNVSLVIPTTLVLYKKLVFIFFFSLLWFNFFFLAGILLWSDMQYFIGWHTYSVVVAFPPLKK
jgi:hypothetical protein